MDNFDISCMKEALALARMGWGHTNPNPMVGAVVVSPDMKIIGRGYHPRAGEAHAEVNAIRDALRHTGSCRGCTIYVTLEPCCTTGRTPPCTKAIIENGFSKVVVGPDGERSRGCGAGSSETRGGVRAAHERRAWNRGADIGGTRGGVQDQHNHHSGGPVAIFPARTSTAR